jgi:hypothetical protein
MPSSGELCLAYKIILYLAANVLGKGHVISIDKCFTFVGLFKELASRQIYATGTIESNRIGLPLALKNIGAFKNIP